MKAKDTNRVVVTKKRTLFNNEFILSGYSDDLYYGNLVDKNIIVDQDLLLLLLTVSDEIGAKNIIDVGANIGYISTVIAKLNPGNTIHAFEPVASNLDILKLNVTQNKLKNITIHPFGLGSSKLETTALWEPENRGSAFITNNENHERYPEHEQVKIKVLDNEYQGIGIENCGLVKVDIEGYELEFMKGSRDFLNKYKPTVVMEANHWCLGGLQNITLGDFLKSTFGVFPYIHGFWGNKTIDVREHTEIFMHENIVNNHYMNLLCSFDKNLHKAILNKYKTRAANLNFELTPLENELEKIKKEEEDLKKYASNLEQEILRLKTNQTDLEQEILILQTKNRDVKHLAKQLTVEVQTRLNNRANIIQTSGAGLIYQHDQSIIDESQPQEGDARQLLGFIHRQDKINIKRSSRSIKSVLKPLAWKVAARSFSGSTKLTKKIARRKLGE